MAGSGPGHALALDLIKSSATATKSLHSFSTFSAVSAALAASVGVTFLPQYPLSQSQFRSWSWNGFSAVCEGAGTVGESEWFRQWAFRNGLKPVSVVGETDNNELKTYDIELKPLFSAFKPRALAATTVRACLINFLPILEAYVQPEDDDMEEDLDRSPSIPVDPSVPMKRSLFHILREVSIITTRRILERAAVYYASPRVAWKLLKDIPKSAARKASRGITRVEILVRVSKTTFRGHALGVTAGWVVQLVLDIYRYIRAEFLPTKGEEWKQFKKGRNQDFKRLLRQAAGNTLKCSASLILASVGAGLGTLLIKPSSGTWIGLAAGDLVGPYLVGLCLDVWIVHGTFTPSGGES